MLIYELLNLSDDSIKDLQKSGYAIELLQLKSILQERKELYKDCKKYLEKAKQYEEIIFTGKLSDYMIKCPQCQMQYTIPIKDLNYSKEIQCQDCGHQYLQNKNIISIFHHAD